MRLALWTGIFLIAATPALANDDDILASRFGNTTLTTDTFGNSVHLYYKADHSFAVKLTTKGVSEDFKGSWSVNDGKVCLLYDNAAPKGDPNPTCSPVSARKVGDSWKVNGGGYEKTVSIVEGIQ